MIYNQSTLHSCKINRDVFLTKNKIDIIFMRHCTKLIHFIITVWYCTLKTQSCQETSRTWKLDRDLGKSAVTVGSIYVVFFL